VDPLRADRVLLLDDEPAPRVFDSPECADRFREERAAAQAVAELEAQRGQADRLSGTPPGGLRRDPTGRTRRSLPPGATALGADGAAGTGTAETSGWGAPGEAAVALGPGAVAPGRPVLLGLGLAGLAALTGALMPLAGWLLVPAAVALLAATGLAIRVGLPQDPSRALQRLDSGWGGVLGAVGAALAAVAALLIEEPGGPAGPLVGAAVATSTVLLRSWLDRRARLPVRRLAAELTAELPQTLRVPVPDEANPFEVDVAERPAAEIRVGEDVLAFEDEVVGVDGVVRAGTGLVLLHPGARTPVRRRPGDPILAGARVTEGALRITVSRSGNERALVRPRRFGSGEGPGAATVARVANGVAGWAGLAALAGATGALAIGGTAGVAGALAAAGAVLVGVPFVGIRRAAELPLVGAALSAARRGVFFPEAAVLDRAGRVTVCALGTRGQLTEGRPVVVEVLPVEGASSDRALALAAGIETAVEDHPIARGVLRHAERHRVEPVAVRRVLPMPGRGITGVSPEGEEIVFGNRQLLLAAGVSVAVADAEAAPFETTGKTVLFLGVGGHVRAIFVLADRPLPGARAAVQRLFDLDVEVVLLSGDHRGTVEVFAKDLDLVNVRAELSPGERGDEVQRLRGPSGLVAAVGIPAHDEAVLRAADVPIALDAAGAFAGERGIALASQDLRDAAAALWIARAARGVSRRATFGSVALGGLVVVLATAGLVGPGIAALFGLAIDGSTLGLGTRLLTRIDLRVPARS